MFNDDVIEEKILEGQEAIDHVAKSIDDRARKIIKDYFNDDVLELNDYEVKIDNVSGEIVVEFYKNKELEHTEGFKV